MRTIIAGPRDFLDYGHLLKAIALAQGEGLKIEEVVCGCARGVDTMGERWARENDIPVKHFMPLWDQYGKRAGFIRNGQMADYADALIAINTGSRGTADMIERAIKKELRVFRYNL